MDEELKFDDDEIEVLDFSNDIPPKVDKKVPEEIEILDFDDEVEPLKETDIINKVTPQDKVEPVKIEVLTEEVTKPKNENLKLNEQLINSIDEIDNKIEKHNKETNVSNRTLLTEDNSTTKNSELLNSNIDKTDTKENIEPKKKIKRKLKGRSIIAGILILGILISVIIALPKINEYVNEQARKEHESANNTTANDNFKSNIDVKEVLTKISEYKSYKYETTNDILTKDKNNNPLTIKTSYTYLFNETKFSVDINKIVADFTYKSKDFYEKLDDVYNLYVNDITTDTYTKRVTTDEEFNKLQSIYPSVINYLSNNYKISKEQKIIVSDGDKISITLKVPIEILKYFSVETDRIQNNIDISKASIEFITSELLFDEDEKLEKIEFIVEDKNLYQEKLDEEVESSVLKYSFTELNKIEDLSLPIQ